MKSRIMKVLGVVVALATLTSLLVGTVSPANAAVGSNTWGVVDTPSAVGNVLTAATDVNLMAASPDGKTLFAWDDTANLMYKSITNGATWGAGVAIGTVGAVVVNGLQISPNYATDNALILVEPTKVWLSTNGGVSFVDVANTDLAAKIGAAVITSADIGNYWANNTLTILIGVGAGALGTATSRVLAFTFGGFSWASLGAQLTDVYGVKFSPNHMTDAEIISVIYGGVNLTMSSRFGALAWGIAAYPDLNIVASATPPTSAIIETASDYVGNTGAVILVGTAGMLAPTVNNVYRITGRAGAAGVAATTSLLGAGLDAPIQSISIAGPIATSVVYVGRASAASGQVYRTSTITGTVVWAAATKGPTGFTANVAVAGTAVFAGTTGIDSAVSVSNDAGVSFNQVGLIDVGPLLAGVLQVGLVSLETVDANTMFLVMSNTAGAGYAARYVFKTTDGGLTWQRIYTTAVALVLISASKSYATDSALVISDGTPTLLKSVNGGATFAAVGTVAAAVTAVFCLDTNNIYVGGASIVYKLGRFAGATGIGAAMNVVSISPNAKDTTKATFAVGTSTGWVYQSTNDVVSFTAVGAAALGAANSIVHYGTDGTLYAANGAAAAGGFRWTGAAWLAIVVAGAGGGSGLEVIGDNTLYVSDATAGAAAFRSLKPLGATAALCEFQPMSAAIFATFPAGGIAVDIDAIAGTADNTILVVDTATAAGTYLYTGRVYGFKDILIVTPSAGRTPATGALLTTVTTATIGWTAVTGATNYAYTLDTAVEVATAGVVGAALGPFTGGTTHTWSYRVIAPLFSRQSTAFTFITALPAVAPAAVLALPLLGAVDVEIDTTFTWPLAAGADGYEFVIAEDLGETNKFAIIDYSATTPTTAHKLRENLKYNTVYWWRVRPFNATTKGDWTVFFFTTAKAPVEVTTAPTTTTPPVIVTQVPPPEITLTIPASPVTQVEVIPQFLLWAVIGVGAVLVIAVIVLIVRTRRIS